MRSTTSSMVSYLSIFILFILSCTHVSARDLRILGGEGGGLHRSECKTGFYLVGFYGQVGGFFDAIGPICRRLVKEKALRLGTTSYGAVYGGSGGREKKAQCRGNESAVKKIRLNTTMTFNSFSAGNREYLDNLEAICANIDIRKDKPSKILITSNDKGVTSTQQRWKGKIADKNPVVAQACPGTELATGIRIRSGKYVDGIGLICSPAPQPPPRIAKIGRAIPKNRKTGDLNKSASKLGQAQLPVSKMGRALPRPVQSAQTILCTSSGQKCNKYAKVALPPGAPRYWAVTLRAPSAHCSSVKYRVTRKNGDQLGRTQYLAGGKSGLVKVPADISIIRIYARGKKGGCNVGKLPSWGVEVIAEPK